MFRKILAKFRQPPPAPAKNLTSLEALQWIEWLCNEPGLSYHEEKRWEPTDPVIANVLMPSDVSAWGRNLMGLSKFKYQIARAVLLDGLPETTNVLERESASHRLAVLFPKLQLRNIWVTTGGPELNNYFCHLILQDAVDRFASWSRESGFHQAALKRPVGPPQLRNLRLSFSAGFPFGGLIATFEKDPRSWISLSFQRESPYFQGWTYNTTLGGAVQILDEFMAAWDANNSTQNPIQAQGEVSCLFQ